MIRYTCGQCGAKLESFESLAGKLDKCPMCGYECPLPSPKPQGLARETLAGDERGTLDPEVFADWVLIGLDHAERIIRKLGKLNQRAWTKAMREEGLELKSELKPSELRQVWGSMMDQAGDKLRQIAVEAGNDLRAQRKEHNMGKRIRKIIAGVGPALDAWRWRIITVAALSFVVWVFTPPVARYQYISSRNELFDSRTGTLYEPDGKHWSREITMPPWSPPWWVPVLEKNARERKQARMEDARREEYRKQLETQPTRNTDTSGKSGQ